MAFYIGEQISLIGLSWEKVCKQILVFAAFSNSNVKKKVKSCTNEFYIQKLNLAFNILENLF